MPLYTYQCKCGHIETAFRSIEDRHSGPECHGQMKLKITGVQLAPVFGAGSMPGYECPVTGEYVTSRKRRREIMRENDLVERG